MAYDVKLKGVPVKNSEGKNILGSDFNAEIKELDEAKRQFWAVGSSESPDREKDVINIDGWNLKNYKKNPVGLWAHNYYEHPIFRTVKTKVDKDNKLLLFRVEFDTHDKAQLTWNQYKNGFLNSFSVGFIPQEFSWNNPDKPWSEGRNFVKQELLELSSVPVPAHPDANIMRSLTESGLITDTVNLVTLGYRQDKYLDEKNNLFWIPVEDLEYYENPIISRFDNGVRTVTANATYDPEIKNVIGYYFDHSIWNEEQVNKHLEDLGVTKTVVYYEIKDISTNDVVLVTEEKAPKPKPDDEGTIDIGDDEEDGCKPRKDDSEEESEEDGCKPRKEEESFDFVAEEYDELIEAKDYLADAEKPYPNEHACRLKDPAGFDSFARKNCAAKHDDKCVDFIYGIKDGKSTLQAMRYKKSIWDAAAAKSHCSSHNGSFEAASSESMSEGNSENKHVMKLDIVTRFFDGCGNEINFEDLPQKDLQIIDKQILIDIKSEMSKLLSMMGEVKELVSSIKGASTEEDIDKTSTDENLVELDISEFPPVSQKDSEDEIEIEVEDIKSLVNDNVVDSIKDIFEVTFEEFRGKL